MEDSIGRPVVNGILMVELGNSRIRRNGLLRSLNGRLSGVHKVLCTAAEIARVGRQDFYIGYDGGYMIPMYSKIGQELRTHFEKLVNWYGKKELIPVHIENNISIFYLNREVKSTETNNVNDSRGSEMAERTARKSNENSESRCCTNW